MLKAMITAKDQTAIVEFPIDQFELHRQLCQIGIQNGAHRVHLTDNEEDDIQVKLFADNDFGNHVIRLFHERDTLDDVHTAVGAIDIASDDVKEQLEEYILHDQLEGTGHLYNTIREIKEALGPIVTTFYCPLSAKIHDREYGDMNDVGEWAIRAAQYEIEEVLEREQSPDEELGDYITDHPAVNEKLVSAVWSIEDIGGTLYGRIDCRSAVPFTPEEVEVLRDGIIGQNSDGFGEHFEQQPIPTDEGDLYVSFWHSGDDYYVRTHEEMDEALGQGMKMEQPPGLVLLGIR